MTRLSAALDRAREHAAGDTPTPIEPSDSLGVAVDVPTAWQIVEESSVAFEPPLRFPRDLPLPGPDAIEVPSRYRFSPEVQDKIVVGEQASPQLVERCQHLAAALHHAQVQRGVRSVLIASGISAEGKSLTATNLALTLSHSYQRRVLLIDADLRRPTLHEIFQLPNEVGLRDSLRPVGAKPLALQRVSPTLWVLTAGRPDPDPMSALVSDTMKQLIAEAVRQFDWVVIDTSPVVLLPDANLLASMVDGALLVVAANRTPYALAKKAIDAIGPGRILGVVLNRVANQVLGSGYESYGHAYAQDRKSGQRRSLPYRSKKRASDG